MKNNNFINKKNNEIKRLKFINLTLRIILTFVGSISIVGLLMFLNSFLGVGYVACLISSIVLSQVYSLICNFGLTGLDDKILNIEEELESYINNSEDNKKNSNIEKIEFRFENLSRENKLKILNYIKKNAELNNADNNILIDDDCISLICNSNYEHNSNCVKKRVK